MTNRYNSMLRRVYVISISFIRITANHTLKDCSVSLIDCCWIFETSINHFLIRLKDVPVLSIFLGRQCFKRNHNFSINFSCDGTQVLSLSKSTIFSPRVQYGQYRTLLDQSHELQIFCTLVIMRLISWCCALWFLWFLVIHTAQYDFIFHLWNIQLLFHIG